MRYYLLILSVFVLATSCYRSEHDYFVPLTDLEKGVMPEDYEPGDTLYFLYSDQLNSDTLSFLVQEDRSYLYEINIHDRYSGYREIVERTLVGLKDARTLLIRLGNQVDDGPYIQSFTLQFDDQAYERWIVGMMGVSKMDTVLYSLTNVDPTRSSDSIVLRYSSFSGIHSLQDFGSGYKLEKLP